MDTKAPTKILIVLLLASTLIMTFNPITLVFSGMSGEGTFWTTDDDPPLTYPPLPPGTYDIVYDTEFQGSWGPMLTGSFPQHLRVRFTPLADGQLVQEARIAWAGDWGGDNTFEIHLVDADTGLTKVTSTITEPDPWDWKAYDVSSLAFYTDGDFYIEFWAIGAEIGIYTDDIPPIHGRSEVNRETGWFYPADWPSPSDFKIRAVVEVTIPVYVDIKPASWPNPLRLKSRGVLPVAILGTSDFDVTHIDPVTIELTKHSVEVGVSPLRWSWEDAATPYTADMGGGHDEGPDGFLDLTLKFKTQEAIDTLGLDDFSDRDVIMLMITGNIMEEYDGTPIEGKDCIIILK